MKILLLLIVGLFEVACYGPREQRGEVTKATPETVTPSDSMPADAEVFVMWENHLHTPFSPYTTLFLYSDTCRKVSANLIDITGDTADVLWERELCEGVRLDVDFSGLVSGLYWAEVNFGDTVLRERYVLLK